MSKDSPMYMEVRNVPKQVSYKEMCKYIKEWLNITHVAGIGFNPKYSTLGHKTFYFRTPPNMKNIKIINKIKAKYIRGQRIYVYDCKNVECVNMLKLTYPKKRVQTKKIPVSNNLENVNMQNVGQVRVNTQMEGELDTDEPEEDKSKLTLKICRDIFTELFDRYPGLEDINTKSNNVFVYELLTEIKRRVTAILPDDCTTLEVAIPLYRSAHPRHTDFALVTSAHRCVDTPLPTERELEVDELALEYLDSLPTPENVKIAHNFYSPFLDAQIKKYIAQLDEDCVSDNPTEEERATALVRAQLKAVGVTQLVKGWVSQFLTFKKTYVRVYGVPRLPSHLDVLLVSRGAARVTFYRPHNCAVYHVKWDKLSELLQLSGKSLDGCTLLVRLETQDRVERVKETFYTIYNMLGATSDLTSDQWEDL